ncbi:uncharacterized protein LOC135125577 isoform X1 [Zophobas morio]|uniref:uncharacterized protein LOC135125577 isoform X1 n=1 Tax=Zophobas morio TaxID=2755281 RepID=UPI003082852A
MEMDLEELVTSLPTVINEIVDTDPYRLHIDADVWVRGGEVGCSDFGDLELFANQACHPTTVISRPVMPAPFPWPASTSATPHCNLFVPPLVRSSTAESTSQVRRCIYVIQEPAPSLTVAPTDSYETNRAVSDSRISTATAQASASRAATGTDTTPFESCWMVLDTVLIPLSGNDLSSASFLKATTK